MRAGRERIRMSEAIGTNRRTFMRKAGKVLATGIGIALIPSVARASNTTCCPASCTPPNPCDPGKRKYHCSGSCTYCTCHADVGCYTIPC
jgi:hypothetical protein